MTDLRAQLEQLRKKLAALSGDIQTLEKLLGEDVPASLNKIRFITEKVLLKLCEEHRVAWGEAEPTLERMIGPLTSGKHVPKDVALHVRTIQNYASPGSHPQATPLTDAHLNIAQAAFIQFLEWYYRRTEAPAPAARPALKKGRLVAVLLLAAAVLAAGGFFAARRFWPTGEAPCSIEQGKALAEQGRYKEAIRCFDRVIAWDPATSLERAFPCRADAYDLWDGDTRPRRALEQYKQGRHLEQANVARYGDAVEAYRRAYELDPSLFWAANNLAYVLATCPDARLRDLNKAGAYAEKACEGSGWKCWSTLDTLAVVRALQGRFDRAVELTRTARRLAPEAEEAQLGLKLDRYKQKRPWEPERKANSG